MISPLMRVLIKTIMCVSRLDKVQSILNIKLTWFILLTDGK